VTVLHELGHGLAAVLLSGKSVEIFVGSYGNKESGLAIPLGKSKLYISRNILRWGGGMCRLSKPLIGYPSMVMTAAGPLLPTVLAGGLVCGCLYGHTHGALTFSSIILLIMAVVSMLFNLRNGREPILLTDGSFTYNDGAYLRAQWQQRHWPAPYMQALVDYKNANYTAAAPVLVEYLDASFDQEDTIRLAIAALVVTEDYDQARTVLDNYGRCYTPDANDFIIQALIHSHFNDLPGIIRCYSEALTLEPDNLAALNNRGYACIRAEQYAESLADFRQALVVDADFAYAHANLGLALLMLDQPIEALGCIQRSLELDDTNSYAYRNLGIYYLQRGELSEARQQFDRAWQLDPHTDLLNDYRKQLQDLTENASNSSN
jgi:tetratricopeptide (TPR) repeat protein